MHTSRSTTLIAVACLLGLAGCNGNGSSGDDTGPDQSTRTSAAPDLEGAVPSGDWWCRLIDREIVEVATDGRTEEAREVLRQNDEEGYLCEVVLPVDGGPGTEPVLALAVQINDEGAADAARQEAEAAPEAQPGPDYLGESFVMPGRTVSIVSCKAPVGSAAEGSEVPFVISLRATSESGGQLTDELIDPVRRSLVEVDQGVGCSPSTADNSDDSSATSAP